MRKLTALLLALLICLPLSGLAEEQKDLTTVRMTLVGDCILGSDEPLHSEKDSLVGMIRAMGNDYAYPFKYAKDFFAQDDYTLINLECVLTDKKSYKNANLYTNFRGPADFVNMLTQNSIEGVSLSNNHALDYGQGGLKDCQKNLTEAGIQWAYNTDTFTFERNGVKFAVLSFRRYYMEMYYQWIEKEIPRMKAEDGVDFVIICLHHGEEYQDQHNDKDQTRFAHHAIDSGADLVVGTHPHVLQGIEVYKNRLIFYSLGNFVFGGNKNPLSDKKTAKQIPTALMSVELQFDQNQLYSTQFTIHPYYETGDEQINNYQPVPVTGDKAQRVMDILQSDTPFTLNPFIEGEGAVQDIIYANDQH